MEKRFCFLMMFIVGLTARAADPVVSNVRATQRADSKVVAIRYDVADADGDRVDVSLKVRDGDIEIPVTSLVGDVGENIRCGKNKYFEWNAGADWNGNFSSNVVFEVTADDGTFVVCYVARTGQTVSYYPEDDGDFQAGVPWPNPRFTDNSNATVTDNLTGLIWVKAPHALDGNAGSMNWNDSIDFCNALSFGGRSDWRLPNIRELLSLMDQNQARPALSPDVFSEIKYNGDVYWSSTSDASNDSFAAFGLCFAYSIINQTSGESKSSRCYVWPVCGEGSKGAAPIPQTGQTDSYRNGDDGDLKKGVNWPVARFIDTGDGTVIDRQTMLMWVQNPHKVTGNGYEMRSWESAINFCKNLTFAGYSDWRLPNVKELESLFHWGRGDWGKQPYEWLNSTNTPFTGIKDWYYWTCTKSPGGQTFDLPMQRGRFFYMYPPDGNYIWPVRGGVFSE